MTIIFNGREFATNKETKLIKLTKRLRKNNVVPKLASIIVGDDPASVLYVNLKKKAAERIGAEVEIVNLPEKIELNELIGLIKNYCSDVSIHGVMLQLPLPGNFSKEYRDKIIYTISPDKDVDGLKLDSKFIPPTAKAVLEILRLALSRYTVHRPLTIISVVGAGGFIGKQIVRALEKEYKNKEIKGIRMEINKLSKRNQNSDEILKNSDIVISVTGVPDLIKAGMVKDGVILIDVGSPKGDIEKSAYEKASFVSPVPGGVGPVTISCLIENLISAAEK